MLIQKSLRQRALEYLGKREYSAQELAQKLKPYADEIDDIDALIADFKARGWLNDQRFAEQLTQVRQRKFGVRRVEHELREKGVADELISDVVTQLKDNELENAREVWRKKFKTAPENRDEWAKQARFMQSRGFDFDVIKKVLNNFSDE